jgi:hypothetical protein
MADWQKTISDLAKCEDFSGQPYYYHVLGIFERGFESPVELKNGECVLRSNKDYELRVLHWDPSADSHTGHKETQWLKLDALEPWLEIRTSPLLAIDCPYDVGSVEIRTGSVSRKEHGLLVLRDDENGHPQNRIKVELCLPVKVKGTIVRTVLYGIALGTLLTSQQLIAIFSNKDVQAAVPLTIAAIALGMGTGLLLALGISKPL